MVLEAGGFTLTGEGHVSEEGRRFFGTFLAAPGKMRLKMVALRQGRFTGLTRAQIFEQVGEIQREQRHFMREFDHWSIARVGRTYTAENTVTLTDAIRGDPVVVDGELTPCALPSDTLVVYYRRASAVEGGWYTAVAVLPLAKCRYGEAFLTGLAEQVTDPAVLEAIDRRRVAVVGRRVLPLPALTKPPPPPPPSPPAPAPPAVAPPSAKAKVPAVKLSALRLGEYHRDERHGQDHLVDCHDGRRCTFRSTLDTERLPTLCLLTYRRREVGTGPNAPATVASYKKLHPKATDTVTMLQWFDGLTGPGQRLTFLHAYYTEARARLLINYLNQCALPFSAANYDRALAVRSLWMSTVDDQQQAEIIDRAFSHWLTIKADDYHLVRWSLTDNACYPLSGHQLRAFFLAAGAEERLALLGRLRRKWHLPLLKAAAAVERKPVVRELVAEFLRTHFSPAALEQLEKSHDPLLDWCAQRLNA